MWAAAEREILLLCLPTLSRIACTDGGCWDDDEGGGPVDAADEPDAWLDAAGSAGGSQALPEDGSDCSPLTVLGFTMPGTKSN